MAKKRSEEEARDFIVNHLMTSPYHELDEETAVAMAHSMEIDSWEEKRQDLEASEKDVGEAWYSNRKRQRRDGHRGGGEDLGKALNIIARAVGSGGGGGGGTGSTSSSAAAAGSRRCPHVQGADDGLP